MSENVNFNFLKSEFISKYNNNAEKSSETNDSDNSIIFSHEEEFKKYIQDETGCDSSVFSFEIDEISKMKFENGKFVNPNQTSASLNDENLKLASDFSNFMLDELNSILSESNSLSVLDINNDGKISTDEAISHVQSIDSDDDGNLDFDELANEAISYGDDSNLDEKTKEEINQNHILDKILSLENGKNVLTVDEYGQVTEESKKKFLDYIKDYSDDGDEVSEADIKRAWDDIQSGKFSYDTDLSQRREEIEEEIELDEENGEKNARENRDTFSKCNDENSVDNMEYDELLAAKDKREQALEEANTRLNDVYNGLTSSIEKAQDRVDRAEDAYQKALEKDEKVQKELKEEQEKLAKDIKNAQDDLAAYNSEMTSKASEQKKLQDEIEDHQKKIEEYNKLLEQYKDDPEKYAEIMAKIGDETSALESAAKSLKSLNNSISTLNSNISKTQSDLNSFNSQLSGVQSKISNQASPGVQNALKNYQSAQTNLENVQQRELKLAQRNVQVKQNQLSDVSNEITSRDAFQIQNSAYKGQFDFDFSLNLSSRQQNELELFKKTWTEHESQYREVESKTGLPAELIAAIHWRESGGNFNTYLHNGDPLGKTTTHVPKGVYFTDWTTAAIDAIKNYGGNLSNVNKNDISTWYDYAERYNGLGYRNKGVPSPYVWAGTSNYKCGKYVADGKYDANYVDQQLGVAVMLQALIA